MTIQRLIGLPLLVGGVIFLLIGVDSTHSAADHLSNTFSGRYTDQTNWYLVGGAVSAIMGMIALLAPGGLRVK